MRIEPFEMERWQSTHEHRVAHNLSESGLAPLSVRELLALSGADAEALLDLRLGYPQTNGSEELRARIAALYPGASGAHVLVTHGGAEANLLACLSQVQPGDEVVVLQPTYMQIPGLVPALGAKLVAWRLRAARGWRPDLDELDRLVGARTRLIAITTPQNPLGAILSADVLERVAAAAERVGAWVLSDEVYRGAELAGEPAPSMWGRSERVLVTSGLSKAYGLPGLRVGWLASHSVERIDALWGAKDYTSITDSPLTMALAALALEPACRGAILARTRAILLENLALVEAWLAELGALVEWLRPEAGAVLWMRYHLELLSRELAERARVDAGTLIVPGAQFGEEGHLRLGFGGDSADLRRGLARLGALLRRLALAVRS